MLAELAAANAAFGIIKTTLSTSGDILKAGNPNKPFLDHVMERVLIHRIPEQLREIFYESKFGNNEVDILKDDSGVQLLAICHKS